MMVEHVRGAEMIDQPALVKIDDPLGDAANAFDWLASTSRPR
jgi:hypothetical protein